MLRLRGGRDRSRGTFSALFRWCATFVAQVLLALKGPNARLGNLPRIAARPTAFISHQLCGPTSTDTGVGGLKCRFGSYRGTMRDLQKLQPCSTATAAPIGRDDRR